MDKIESRTRREKVEEKLKDTIIVRTHVSSTKPPLQAADFSSTPPVSNSIKLSLTAYTRSLNKADFTA